MTDLSPGPFAEWLQQQGFATQLLAADHLGIERIGVDPAVLPLVAAALKAKGFDYLQVQGAYDEGPGKNLVSFYHLAQLGNSDGHSIIEVRLEVSLPRSGDLTVPSLYPLYRGADWQERECFDMFGITYSGHPLQKRLLMPEDWVGYPLRKDYVQPDFYELQDAH
ncbi:MULTISPECIES: NAD(P)H-quinone oxidoreductase subunit J [unclassified Synechococcus]|uniref:NAD(P)H-quinone oxidoreductase subunit J n=1 Tax=unclassified Synechococcus TaxID=2626047 RepID=UPI0020CDA535|nr:MULTISPECIES: NAD(P)H-quinone oxidoreductase subunit J [unclassified Synechococcus]MCP9940289.1 NAD(P)H-quinone oxidoreductase subunit J [Synechococcus sp. Cruz CV12-2-Slac-r]